VALQQVMSRASGRGIKHHSCAINEMNACVQRDCRVESWSTTNSGLANKDLQPLAAGAIMGRRG
jgi:hypothetical protein